MDRNQFRSLSDWLARLRASQQEAQVPGWPSPDTLNPARERFADQAKDAADCCVDLCRHLLDERADNNQPKAVEIALFMELLSDIEELARWRVEAVLQGPISDNLALVYLPAAVISTAIVPSLQAVDEDFWRYAHFNLTDANAEVRKFLGIWSGAIRGQLNAYPIGFGDNLAKPESLFRFGDLPTLLYRYDRKILLEFVESIFLRLLKIPAEPLLTGYLNAGAFRFLKRSLEHFSEQHDFEELASLAERFLPRLCEAVDRNRAMWLKFLVRMMGLFRLNTRADGNVRDLLRPCLLELERTQLPRWTRIASQDSGFADALLEAYGDELRAAITGRFRDSRRVKLSQSLHSQSPTVSLLDPSSPRHTVSIRNICEHMRGFGLVLDPRAVTPVGDGLFWTGTTVVVRQGAKLHLRLPYDDLRNGNELHELLVGVELAHCQSEPGGVRAALKTHELPSEVEDFCRYVQDRHHVALTPDRALIVARSSTEKHSGH